jgi:hypothetical protein
MLRFAHGGRLSLWQGRRVIGCVSRLNLGLLFCDSRLYHLPSV